MSSFLVPFCAILVLLSAFLSASEIALFSLSRFQLRALKDRLQPQTHRKMKRLLQDPGGLLITILVLNEIINIALSTLITESIAAQPEKSIGTGIWWVDLLLGASITTPIVLLACEMTPKVIGARANQLVATLTASPLHFIYDVMKPVRIVLTRFVGMISRWIAPQAPGKDGHEDAGSTSVLRESEFMMMIEEGQREGAIQQSEVDLIKNVFELDDTRVEEIYTPLSQAKTLPEQTTIRNALSAMRTLRYSRIPVTSSTGRKQIVGILYSKDLLRARLETEILDKPISEMMRRPLFVSPSMQLNAVFRKFKQQKTHMAVVQKQSGEIIGVVTMNDVLECLFDDLLEEEEEEGAPTQ